MKHLILTIVALLLSALPLKAISESNLKKLDILLFINAGDCNNYPYRFLKDLNGKDIISHVDKDRAININIGALTSTSFPVWSDPQGYKAGQNVNRAKLIAEIIGRESSEEFQEIVRKNLSEYNFSKVEFNTFSSPTFRCDLMNQYHISALLRADLDLNVYGPAINYGLKNKEIIFLKEIPSSQWLKPLTAKIENEFVDVRRTISILESDSNSIGSLVKYVEGQNYFKVKSKSPCIVNPQSNSERDTKFGYRASEKIISRFGLSKKIEFQASTESLELLWQKIQTDECPVSFITGDEFKRLRKVLEEDKQFNYRVELGLNQKESFLSFIQFKGYKTLMAFEFANNFNPPLQPEQITRLASHGIDSVAGVEVTTKRMQASNYQKMKSIDINTLFTFLSDEEAGKKQGLSPSAYRDKRIAEAEEERRRQQLRMAKIQAERSIRSFTLSPVCIGDNLAKTFMENIIQMYASNTHVSAIASYITSMPSCLLPRQNTPISGNKLEEFYRMGRFVGVRTTSPVNGQHIYGMVISTDWDLSNR
jgi:hypothetical protein